MAFEEAIEYWRDLGHYTDCRAGVEFIMTIVLSCTRRENL